MPVPIAVVTVVAAELKAALARFARIVPRKPRVPVLEGIRLSFENSRLILYATDLEVGLRIWIDTVKADSPDGLDKVVAVPGYKSLVSAVKGIRTDHAVLSIPDQNVVVADTTGGTRVTCWAPGGTGDYPEPPPLKSFDEVLAARIAGAPEHMKKAGDWEKTLESWRKTLALEFRDLNVSGPSLAEGMRFTLPGVATGGTNYALEGIHLGGGKGGEAELAASNARVLYIQRVQQLSGDKLGGAGFILLPSACEWLAKHAANDAGIVIRTDCNNVVFTGGNWTLGTRQIEGIYPSYHDIMPARETLPGNMKVNRKALLDALKTASVHCDGDTRKIDLLPASEGEALEVRAVRGGQTEFSTAIPAASRKCRPAIFNIDFLTAFLAAYPGETVTFRYCAECKHEEPVAVYDSNREFVIMPLNNAEDAMTDDEKAEHARMIESYTAALAGSDQDFQGENQDASAPCSKRLPSFKAVVARAKADSGYRASLLAALDVSPSCEARGARRWGGAGKDFS